MARSAALARELTGSDAACALWSSGATDLVAFATAGAVPKGGESLCRRVMEIAAPVSIRSRSGHWMAVPLRGAFASVGAIAVWAPSVPDEAALEALAELAASGARNAEQVGRLRQRTKRGDELLRHAAHEVRRPLTVMNADLELLEDDLARAGPERDAVLARLRAAVDDMRELAEDVLGYERLVAGVAPDEPFDLAGAVDRACSAYADRVRHTGEPAVVVHGDESLVVSAIRNLVENAVKYSPPDSPVEVTWAAAGDFVALEVHDMGPGIPSGDHTRIFEPFRRLHSSSRVPGVGLGLSLVRAVADAHGGSVRVESDPGTGTTFTLVLPRGPQATDGQNGNGVQPEEEARPSQPPSGAAAKRSAGRRRSARHIPKRRYVRTARGI
jgi:signal transduction histidine kinase